MLDVKLLRSIYWVVFTLGALFLAGLHLPLFWYLDWRGQQKRKEAIAWKFAHWWGRVVLGATGSKVVVSGSEHIPLGPVVLMGNHQSYFDIMLMLGYVDKPLAFIAKQELTKLPLIKQWMGHLGCLFLDRNDIRQASKVFQQAVEKLQGGSSMVIFPEGTRSRSADIAAFKKGSMKLPIRANVPIVPISIDGTYKIYEGNGSRIGPALIKLVISPPVLPDIYTREGSSGIAELVLTRVEQGLEAAACQDGME